MIQLIFVVETDNKTKSDDRYISKLINNRYDLSTNNYKIQFVHMGGKDKYKEDFVIEEINGYLVENSDGENNVIYCFDTDKINVEYTDKDNFKKKKEYCKSKGYKLIWFNHTIEKVLLNKTVESNKKKQESIKYLNRGIIVDENRLKATNEEHSDKSNIYGILDTLLPKKIYIERRLLFFQDII